MVKLEEVLSVLTDLGNETPARVNSCELLYTFWLYHSTICKILDNKNSQKKKGNKNMINIKLTYDRVVNDSSYFGEMNPHKTYKYKLTKIRLIQGDFKKSFRQNFKLKIYSCWSLGMGTRKGCQLRLWAPPEIAKLVPVP